ncbi:transcription elongation factor Spt6 [Hesseltinella vesiculosa]|uniref:Transcription elongation factor Spt6 n=1 Tax=Hesseltinella vesiculosa TaxID=101127 RepID=A0A1X2GWC6_9FUNG|nr:transcription elongation factor Spt6 [Hesseltinella vesiculosa]
MSMQDSDDEIALSQHQRQRRTNPMINSEDESDDGDEVGFGHDSDEDDDEDEDEDDEEEARKVAEGFIVDDDDQEDDEDEARTTSRRKKKRRMDDFDQELDEEDLELLEENTGLKLRNEPELKRLKRGRQLDDQPRTKTSIDMFSDDEADDNQHAAQPDQNIPSYRRREMYDEMGDFIADEDEDDLDQILGERRHDEAAGFDDVSRKAGKDILDMLPDGISEDVLMDMYDIFGDGGDYEYALYPEDQTEMEEERPEPQLADIFEPSELAERMLTEEDEKIRNVDVPERLQMRYEGLHKTFSEPTMEEIQQQGAWVAKHLAQQNGLPAVSEEYLTAVTYIVRFFTKEFLEVPHIKDHRRDFFTSIDPVTNETVEILSEQDLWDIYDLDFKYHGLLDRKRTLNDFLAKYDIDSPLVRDAEAKVDRLEQVTDIFDYVNLKHTSKINLVQSQKKGPKRPQNKSLAELMENTPITNVLSEFGILAKEFGANYSERNRRYYPEDSTVPPLTHAEANTDDVFNTADKVLKAARSVLAQEIAYDMQVRRAMRHDWEEQAVICVNPTEKGFTVIDALHPLRPYKFLLSKPMDSFQNGEFLHILKGESDGLLTIQIGLPDREKWVDDVLQFYLSDGFSDIVKEWNEQRRLVFDLALADYLEPLMDKHIRERMRAAAQDCICKQAAKSLYAKVNVGPYRPSDADRQRGLPKVLAVSCGAGDPKSMTSAVVLNHRGKVVDQLQVGRIKDERELMKLESLIRNRKPSVVVVAGYNAQVRHLFKSLHNSVANINSSSESGSSPIDLLVVDDEAARLYKNSKRAQDEFPGMPEVMRYCVALARRLQNPLLEYTSLGRDLLTIRFHQHQHLVPEDLLLASLERSLISVVNDMGIDINAAAKSPYIASALPFICGLGPRKAQSILKKVEAMGELDSRNSLVMDGMTAANTFVNCASFIRIRDVDGADILDDTRIHPEDYELARKMAGDALEIDEDDMEDYASKVAVVARVVKEYPKRLNDLILDDYAAVLREQYNAPKRQILEHIKLELQGPYYDRRTRFVRPSLDEIFAMVTGETPDTLREGFLVPAKVMALRGRVANCVLDSGLDGLIYLDFVSDSRVGSVEEVLSVDQTLNCKIERVDKERYLVELSCKESDTKPGSDTELRALPKDEYYDKEGEDRYISERHKQQKKRERNNRTVNHPLFQQLRAKEAEDYLDSRLIGDLVIRPSSRGQSHMVITWKVADGVFQHIDVVEEKPNIYSAASKYLVGDQVFEDLDELIVTYVEAISQKVEELMAHQKFQVGGSQALDDYLDRLTKANPKKSEYGFCLSDKYPGYFDLGFKLNQRSVVSRWAVKVLPDGYRLQKTAYPNVDDLINGFKRLQQTEAKRKLQQQQQQRPRPSHPPAQHPQQQQPHPSHYGHPPPPMPHGMPHPPPPHHYRGPPPPGAYPPPPHAAYPPPPHYAQQQRHH